MSTTLTDPDRAAPPPPAAPAGEGPGDAARSDRILVIGTAIALAVGLASSVWQLTMRPFWHDEAISVGATHQLRQTIRGTGGTMAVYYVLLDGWTALFGTSLVAVRSLSVLTALVAVVATALFVRRALRPLEGALAVILLAGLPAFSRMSQDARAYALAMVLTAACWICLDRALEADEADPGDRRAWPWFLALGPVAVVGVGSHGLFLLQLAPVMASVLFLPRRWHLVVRLLPAAVMTAVAVGALMSIGASDVGDWVPPLSADQARSFVGSMLTYDEWPELLLGGLMVVGVVVLVGRAVRSAALDRWRALVPVWWALVPPLALLVLSVPRPSLIGRYVMASVPGIAMLIAVGTVQLLPIGRPCGAASTRDRPSTARTAGRVLWGVAAVALVVVLVWGVALGRVTRGSLSYESWDDAAALVAEEARPGDALIFNPSGRGQFPDDTARPAFEAAWAREDPTVTPDVLSPARPLGEVRRFDDGVPLSELSELMMGYGRVWFVQFPGFGGTFRELLALEPAASAFQREQVTTFDGGVQVLLVVRNDR